MNFGALHILHVFLLAQFTLAHLLHCQSSALNRPRDLSAAAFPISMPNFFLSAALRTLSVLHRLHAVRRAKFTFLHLNIGRKKTKMSRLQTLTSFEGNQMYIWLVCWSDSFLTLVQGKSNLHPKMDQSMVLRRRPMQSTLLRFRVPSRTFCVCNPLAGE